MNERAISGFQKWADLSGAIYDIISIANRSLPSDLVVFMVYHEESTYTDEGVKVRRIGTEGKQLGRMVLESMATVVLFTRVEFKDGKENSYFFQTQTDGQSTGKSPIGMFDEFEIPNDYQYVVERLNAYNN